MRKFFVIAFLLLALRVRASTNIVGSLTVVNPSVTTASYVYGTVVSPQANYFLTSAGSPSLGTNLVMAQQFSFDNTNFVTVWTYTFPALTNWTTNIVSGITNPTPVYSRWILTSTSTNSAAILQQ